MPTVFSSEGDFVIHWQTGRYLLLIGTTILFLVHGAGAFRLPFLERLESIYYDFKVRHSASNSKDSRIVIIDIDEKSLAGLGSWPWPRDRLATLVDTLFDHYHVGVLGFDMVFSEADASSGLPYLESLAKGPLSQDSIFLTQFHKLRLTLDRDRTFAQSLRDRPVMLGFNFMQTSFSGLADSGKLPPPIITLHELGHDDINAFKAFGYSSNIAEIEDAASGAGFLDNPMVDSDGVVRNIPLLQVFNGALYQSFSLGIIRAILGDPPLTLGFRPNGRQNAKETSLDWIALGQHRITVDPQGGIFVPYRGKQGSFPYFSAIDILERIPEKQSLDAAIVLIGSSIGSELRRPIITPFQQGFPNVEIHANIISGMLDGTFKSRPALYPWTDVALLAIIGIVFTLFFPRIILIWRFSVVFVFSWVLLAVNFYVWQSWDLQVPLVPALLLMLHLTFIDTAFEWFGVSLKRNKMCNSFGKHLSISMIDELVQTGHLLSTSSEQRETTVVMVSVRDFYRLAHDLSPGQLEQWIHGFLTPLTEIIHQYRGTLGQHHGASILAYWGVPVDDAKHGRNALSAVMAMIAKMEKLEDEFQMRGLPVVKCIYAIQTGTVTSGVMGSDFHREFKVLGEPVQQVQSMISLVEGYSTLVLVGERTKASVSDMVFRELDLIVLEESDEPVSIYEPVGFRDQVGAEKSSRLEFYHKTIAQFRRKEWDLAEQGFKKMLQKDPEDRQCEIYLTRIRRFRKTPPPMDWNGTCRPPG
ncbi:MAG: adenylate/guanylate cyclase domain-containing protein [Magnetococcales bacterium]|nr:adenylate/guanylate cyclase domain-containing protein [Magnetococcales bacterium]MBF0148695.1 adenylate/guanylate cyclase domain-containing protein [Magnetococcales bacterium]